MNGDLTALDMALVPSFFISYGIIGLIQLNALFAAAYLRFAAISAAVLIIAYAFPWIFSGGCSTHYSSLICANNAQGIFGFAFVWSYVSVAMLGMFLFNRSIHALRDR